MESQLRETGFITMFLVPLFSLYMTDSKSPQSVIAIHLYRWLIFGIMIGAVSSLIKWKMVDPKTCERVFTTG